MKDVNIIIVNYKMKDEINQCLTSLFLDLKDSSLDVNVVVVDNASNDGIQEFLKNKFSQVSCIMLPENNGFGFAQNTGIKAVEAKYYFILNPDTIFPADKHCIQALYNFMEANPKIGMAGPKLIYPDGSLQYSCWRFPPFLQPFYQRTKLGQSAHGQKRVAYHHMRDFDHNKTMPVDAIMGSVMFIRGEALEQVGTFDTRFFMYYEDIDLSRRMWEGHWPVYYVHDIIIKHHHGRGSAKIPGVFRALIKNKLARVHVMSWLKYLWKWRMK